MCLQKLKLLKQRFRITVSSMLKLLSVVKTLATVVKLVSLRFNLNY